jgi:hypothetical protein
VWLQGVSTKRETAPKGENKGVKQGRHARNCGTKRERLKKKAHIGYRMSVFPVTEG